MNPLASSHKQIKNLQHDCTQLKALHIRNLFKAFLLNFNKKSYHLLGFKFQTAKSHTCLR